MLDRSCTLIYVRYIAADKANIASVVSGEYQTIHEKINRICKKTKHFFQRKKAKEKVMKHEGMKEGRK